MPCSHKFITYQNLHLLVYPATVDSSCSALVRECIHAAGEEIPEKRGRIYIITTRQEEMHPIMSLSKAAS